MKTTATICLLACLSLASSAIYAQKSVQHGPSYSSAIGIRVGGTDAITLKKRLGNSALEGLLGLRHHGFSVTVLFEVYEPSGIQGLSWYYGGGGHVAIHSEDIHHHHGVHQDADLALGVDGVLGVEYRIPSLPFAISADVKPYLELPTSGSWRVSADPGLGVKLAF